MDTARSEARKTLTARGFTVGEAAVVADYFAKIRSDCAVEDQVKDILKGWKG